MVAPRNIKKLQSRSRDLQARRVDHHTFVVESTSNPNANHVVTIQFDADGRTIRARCTCAWAIYHGIACSHVLAALEYMAANKSRTLSFWEDEQKARRQKHRLFRLIGDQRDEQIWVTSRSA
jgi:hypothetical protein